MSERITKIDDLESKVKKLIETINHQFEENKILKREIVKLQSKDLETNSIKVETKKGRGRPSTANKIEIKDNKSIKKIIDQLIIEIDKNIKKIED